MGGSGGGGEDRCHLWQGDYGFGNKLSQLNLPSLFR